MLRRIVLFVPVLVLSLALPTQAQPLAPPPPAVYEVHLRYQIEANRNERVAQYFVIDADKAVKVPDPQPRSATRAPGRSPVSRTNASTRRSLAWGANTS